MLQHGKELWQRELHNTLFFLQMHRLLIHFVEQEHRRKPCPPTKEDFLLAALTEMVSLGTSSSLRKVAVAGAN